MAILRRARHTVKEDEEEFFKKYGVSFGMGVNNSATKIQDTCGGKTYF